MELHTKISNRTYKRKILILAFMANFLSWGGGFNIIAPLGPYIAEHGIAMSYADVGLLYALTSLAIAIFSIPAGIIGDHIGARKTVGIGMLIIGIASIGRSSANTTLILMIAQFISGIGLSFVFPNVPKIIGQWFESDELGFAVSIGGTIGSDSGNGIFMATSIPVTMALAGVWIGGWRINMLLVGFLLIITAVIWFAIIREKESESGTLQTSILDSYKQVLGNGQLWLLGLTIFSYWFAVWMYTGLATSIYSYYKIGEVMGGIIISTYAFAALPFEFLGGIWSDKIGRRKPFTVGCSFLSILLFLGMAFFLKNTVTAFFFTIMSAIIMGIMYAIPWVLPLEMDGIGEDRAGVAEGFIFALGMFGGFLGPYIGGMVLAYGGPKLVFLMCAGTLTITTLMFTMIRETGWKAKKG